MDDVTMEATAEIYAAAAVCSAIYGMVAVGRSDAASRVFGGLSNELRRDVLRIMEADLPTRVAEAVKAGVLQPDEVFVDGTTQPPRIDVGETVDAE
ncbi:hypothetical protein [Nocardia sp. NRRL S-836]|uniref:hypothetical protein n=1 Tax=Nocardia sp. NRRL S-836 TaxID=1519492 RepID=UPI0006AED831|nr:hypothetical protein [Nocardia sp. NRRL S-836]